MVYTVARRTARVAGDEHAVAGPLQRGHLELALVTLDLRGVFGRLRGGEAPEPARAHPCAAQAWVQTCGRRAAARDGAHRPAEVGLPDPDVPGVVLRHVVEVHDPILAAHLGVRWRACYGG